MAANEEGKNTPQNDPFKNLLEGDTKKPKNIDLQKVDILSGTPTLATPNITNILPGSSLYSLELSKVYPRSLQRYASELKPDQWQLGTDWEQSMAKNQSRATKFGRGAKNLGRTFYATALETVAGSFTAGPNAWNSPFWRDLDEYRQKAKEESPIYKPEGYDDMGFFKAAGTAAFWADEFQEGIGFFTGAMAGSMLLTGPLRGAAKTLANPNLVKGVARGSRLNFFRGLAKGGVKGADDVYNGISRSIFLKEGLKNIAKQAKTSLGKSNLMMTSLFAARSEAAVEARDTVKSTYSTLQNRYVKDNNLSDISQIPGIVKSQLYNTALGLGNNAFTTNFALLTLTNLTTFKLLGIGGNVGSRAIGSSMVGRYLNTPVKGGITRLQKVTGLGARGAKNVRSAGRLGQGMFVESIGQEYPQYVIQDASINYAVDKHFEGNTQSLSEHYLDSASNAFSDPHGQKAIALGALISAFAMGGGRVASKVSKKYSTQGQKIDANIEELLELADAGKFNERMQQTQNMNVVEKNMLEAQTLWEQGENKLAQNARDRAVAAHVSQLMQFEGGVNNMTATLDEIEQDLTDEQFAEMVGQPVESLRDETGKIPMKTRQEYTGNLKEKVKTLSNIYKDIQVAFPEITTPTRLQYARADETQTEEYQQEVLVQKYLKEQLYYTLAGSHLSDKAGEELLDAMEDSSGVNKDTLQTELDKILEGLDVGLTSEGLPGQPADPAAFKKAMEAVNEQLNKLITSNKNVNRRDRKGRFTATPDTFLELAADYMMHRLNANHAVELYNELVGDSKNNRQKLRAEAAEEVKKAEKAENLSNQQVIERKLKDAVTPADLDGVKGGVRTKAGRAVSRRRKELTRQQKDLYKQFDKSSAPEELLEQLKKNRSDQKQAEIEAAYYYWSSSKNRAAAAENKNNPPQVAPDGKPIKPTTITPAAPQGSTSANSLAQQAREAATKNAGKKGKKGKTITLQALTPEQKAEQDRFKNEQTQSTPTAADLIKEINTPEVVPGVSVSGAPKFNATGQEIFDETEKEKLAKEQGFTDWKHVLNSLNIQEKKAKGTSITKERFEDLTDEQIIDIGSKSKSATKVREAKETKVEDKKAEEQAKQKVLEDKVEELKAKDKTFRDEDGSVYDKSDEDWKQNRKDIDIAKENARRGNLKEGYGIPIRLRGKEYGDAIAVGEEAKIEEEKIEALIQEVLNGKKTAEEVILIISKEYAFLLNEMQSIRDYISDRTTNAPEIGNNKQSFAAWRKGKMDSDLSTATDTTTDLKAKKADIERRNQEELDKTDSNIYIKSFTEFQKYGNTVKEAFDNLTEASLKEPANKELSDLLDYVSERLVPEDIQKNSNKNPNVQEYIKEELENIKKQNKSPKSRRAKINAKYDAELASLESTQTSEVKDDAPIIATPKIDGTIETGRGQYEFVDRNDIDEGIVFIDNGDGTYSPKPFFEHPIPVRYERLSDPSLTVGATVEVVLDEGVDFFDLNRKAFKESELKDWQFSPMYLVKDGERIGLLQMDVVFEGKGKTKKIKTSGKNPIRQQIYKNLAGRNKVTLQITDKKFNKGNILNAKTKDGKRIESKLTDVFSNTFTINNLGIAEATENAPIPLIFTESDTGVVKFRKLVPENSPSEMTKNHIAKVNEALDSISDVASAGVVYTAVVTPNGEVTVIPLSTAFLNEKAVEEVIELIKTNKHSEISNIVGLQVAGETFNPKNFKEGDIKKYLLFEPQADNTVKDTIYRFRFPGLENGQVVKMFGRQMINMLKSNKFSYIIENPSYNNAYDSIDYNPEADPNTVEDAKEIEDFKNRFEDLLRNKRFQVPKETANRPEQFNKFTQESIGLNPSKNVTEDSADTILTTNVYNNNGSLFYDVTLTLGNPTIENKQEKKKVKKKIKPSVSTGSKTAPAKDPNNIEGLGTTPKDDRGDIFGAQKQAEQQPKETSGVEAEVKRLERERDKELDAYDANPDLSYQKVNNINIKSSNIESLKVTGKVDGKVLLEGRFDKNGNILVTGKRLGSDKIEEAIKFILSGDSRTTQSKDLVATIKSELGLNLKFELGIEIDSKIAYDKIRDRYNAKIAALSKPKQASEVETLESNLETEITKELKNKTFKIGKVPFKTIELKDVNLEIKKVNDGEFSIAVDNKGKSIFGKVSAVLDFQRRDLDSDNIYIPNPQGFILWNKFLESDVASMPKSKVIVDNRFNITLGTLKGLKASGISKLNFPERFVENFKNEYSSLLDTNFSSVSFGDTSRLNTVEVSIDDLIRILAIKSSQPAQQGNEVESISAYASREELAGKSGDPYIKEVSLESPKNTQEYVSYRVKENEGGRKYLTNLSKNIPLRLSTWKGAGYAAYVDFINTNNIDEITTDTDLTQDGINVLERLEKNGLVVKTDAKVIKKDKTGKGEIKYIYNKPLYEFTGKSAQQNIAERFDKTDEAIAYLETTFGKEAVQVADRLANIGGLIPYAYFKNGLIHMSAGNNIDQAYHEAFHLVFNLFFDESTKKKLLAEAKSKSDATTDLAAEEFLAEVYRQVKAADTSKFGGEVVDKEMLSLVDFNNKLSEGDLTIETAMSLIEKLQLKEGELPKLQRSIDKYKPGKDNPLFFHMEGFGVNAQKMVVETIATQFMDLAESRTETDGLLNKSDEDSIPVWWLRHSFRDKEGNPLEADVAMELADAIQNKDKEKGAEILKNNPEIDPTNFLSLPDRDDSGNVFQFENDAATKQKLSSIFYQVYKNWDTKIEKETDNVVQQGWVEALKNRMATQALRIKAVEDLIDTQDLEDQDNQLLTKIYDKPQVETDPMLEGTAALRPIFNNFKRLDPNFLGYRTIIAPQEVMREVQTYLSDTLSFSEGLANMLSAAQFRPEIREIVETIKSLPVATQAKIDYHLRLGYNKFMMVEVTEDGTKFYASNQGSLTKAKLHEWKRSSRKLPNTFVTNYLYDVTIDQETQLHVLSVTDTKAQNIVKQYNEALKGILNERKGGIDPVTASSETISAPIKALSNLIWGMGIKIMDTKNSSEQALQTYINVGVKEFRGDDVYTMQGQELLSELINQNQNGLILLVKKIANVKASGLSLIEEDVTAKTRQIDVFDEHRRLLGEFSKVSKMFNKPKSEAFVAANGNKVFPNNKYTFLGKQVIKLSTDTEYFRDIVDMYMADPAFNPNGTDQLMSLTFKVLTDPQFGETIRANFERTMYDGYKKKFESVAKIDYKNQDEFQSLEVRLHHFVNAGNSKFTRIAIPTQAGRSRNDFIQIPRLNTMKENFGIEYSRADQIRAIIIQDLARIAQAEDFMQKNPESAYDEVYHTQENYRTMSFEFLELPEDDNGENPSHYIEEYLEGVGTDPTGNAAFVEKFIQEAEEKVAEHIAKSEKQVAAYIAKGGITLKNLNPEYLKNLGISNLGQVITQYVEHDLIWQSVEFAKVFANGIYNYKSTNDFYKRMATITTPVYQMSAQGTLPADSNFGMPKEFTKAVLNDVELGMETRDVLQHAADLQTIVSELQSQVKDNLLVTPEKIQSIENSYKTGRDDNNQPIVNKTDATGIISVEFRKSMMQVRDEWTDSHEEAYQNDLKPNGRFIDNNGNVPTLIPQKPFMREASLKDGRVQQFIGKNSFVTLTNELASKTPVLLDIYNRMNAVGTYSSLGKVQLFNMDSAEKASRSGIHTLYAENGTYVQGQLKNIATVTHLSENLGIGQEIRDKAEEKVTINRQFRKGLLSIVIPAEQYSVNGYLKDVKKRLDLSGEQLINLLQAVNVEIASRNFNNFLNKTGLRGVNKGARQKSEDRLQTLKQLKSSFYGQLQDLNNLYVTAMDIVPSTIGGYSYKLPMSYPPIANKMGQLFFSGFSRATHKAKTRGVEAVQLSELGGTERDGELRFLHIEEDEAGNVAVAHAQVDIKRSTAMKMGMTTEEGKFLIAYRVPNQGPSSTIILQVRNFLPESHPKSIRVPGAITTQSGSDFDIDKLFVLFPELDTEGNKIFPNTDTLDRTGYDPRQLNRALRDKKSFTDAMLSNLIIDLNTAVYTNPVHLIETMEPLDAGLKLIKDILSEVETKLNAEGIELAPELSINSPITPILVEVFNKTGIIGRGLKANALAGLQTAIGSNITVAPSHAPRVRNSEGTVLLLDTVIQRDYTNTQTTGRNISLGLNRAVDSEKTPEQLYKLNEHPFNSTVTSFLESFGVPAPESYMLLQMPAVREVSAEYREKGRGVNSMKDIVLRKLKKYKTKATEATLDQDPIPLEFSEMMNNLIVSKENKSMQGDYLITYYKHFIAADQHRKNNSAITPDTLERVNEPAGLNAYFDSVDYVLDPNNEDRLIFGAENVLEGNSYPLQKEFYENMVKAAELSTNFGYVEFTQSAQKLKQDLRNMLNYDILDVDQHRLIDRAVYTILMSDKQSPFHFMYQRSYVEELLMGDNNISYKLEELKSKYPNLMNNEFFRRLSPHPTNSNLDNKVFPIVFENMEDYNGEIREEIETDSYRLYFEPQEYTDTIDGQNEIRTFMKDVVANAFLSGGFFKSPFSYFDMIHFDVQQAVSEPITLEGGETLNITNFFNLKFEELAKRPDALDQMAHHIIKSVGKFKAGKRRLVPSVSVKGKNIAGGVLKLNVHSGMYSDSKGFPRYVIADIREGKERESRLMRLRGFDSKNSAVYDFANEKSEQFKLLELGIRDATGKMISKSLINEEGQTMDAFMEKNVLKKKRIKTVDQRLESRKICIRL